MSKIGSLPELMWVAARVLGECQSDDARSAEAWNRFLEETRRLPQKNIGEVEQAVRMAIYDLGAEPKRLPWQRKATLPKSPYPWFDLFHASGYRRESALQNLNTAPPSGFLFLVLLRRLNDWVPQVREAAIEAVDRVLAITSPEDVAGALWVVLPVERSWLRMDSPQAQILDKAMVQSGVQSCLVERLVSARSGPAGLVLRQASRRSCLDDYLPELARRAVQPVVRSLAYSMLLNGKAVWADGWNWKWVDKSMGLRVKEPRKVERPIVKTGDLAATLRAAAQDRAAAVRRVAGDYLAEHCLEMNESALELAHILVADKAPSVAGRGAFVLRRTQAIRK